MSLFLSSALSAAPTSNPPAEELRLNTFQFREWLKNQGLAEVLDLHLKDFPPSDPTTTALLQRDFKLGEFADARRSTEERQAAINEANRILARLIDEFPADPRCLQWRYTLAHSYLYDQGEPFATSILFFGGGIGDVERLADCTRPALETIRALRQQITRENARIDRLTPQEFEDVERRGLIEQLERIEPSADYLLLWSLFYDALWRGAEEAVRSSELREIQEILLQTPALLQTPQESSGIQAPAQLLAGMTARRLGQLTLAKENLDRAFVTWDRIKDGVEKDRLRWVASLASIEKVRAERDDQRYDAALTAAARVRELGSAAGSDPFGLHLAAALLERTIHQTRADALGSEGDTTAATAAREKAWLVLHGLGNQFPDRRDAMNATLLASIGLDADPAKLDPMEQVALMAGLCWEAQRDPASAAVRYRRALAVGEAIVGGGVDARPLLASQTLFQLGQIQMQLGDSRAAAGKFRDAARSDSKSPVALQAASLAVQLSAELCQDGTRDDHAASCSLYSESLDALLANHGDSDAGRYWRFFKAQLLDEKGEFDAAAREYARVDAGHEHFLDAGFLRLRAMGKEIERRSTAEPRDAADLSERAETMLRTLGEFSTIVEIRPSDDQSTQDRAGKLVSDATLLTAEALVLPGVERGDSAIELTTALESNAPVRVWRARFLAYELLGRIEDARRAVDELCSVDTVPVRPILQALHDRMVQGFESSKSAGESEKASRRADLAMLLAEKIVALGSEKEHEPSGKDQRGLRVQWAEALLRAGKADQAMALFDELDAEGESTATFGRAEAQFLQGRYADALPAFAKMATTLPAEEPTRWKALLRDLQCRTRLNHPPEGILKVIAQQRFLYPDLGGPEFTESFETLRIENEKRRGG